MDFYYLVCEQDDGFRFPIRSSFSSSEEEIKEYLNGYRKDLYKSVEIKKVSVSMEEIIVGMVKNERALLSGELLSLLFPDLNK